ncbi:type I restriction endonuclease subunit R, EcoR124 family [Gardnerella vaginalis]|uniref:type I restriction endonuclease subunit R, EcoR124 family n=1 Tax=Gardnerella vaginalis TaxID=2702 RepID=UPI0023E803EB|nr:hypothetical protein [Gardnerella vaginalis]
MNAPSSKQNRKQHIQHPKPPHAQQTPTQIRDKIRVEIDASPQLRSKKKLIEGFIAQLNEKELRELADYSNGAAAIARAEKKSRIVESMRNMFNEFVGLIGVSQYDSQKD